nr:adhesion G-protein coupled receptor F1-like [Nerophis lumbriciformis]
MTDKWAELHSEHVVFVALKLQRSRQEKTAECNQQHKIGFPLHPLSTINNSHCLGRTRSIIKDDAHVSFDLFNLLPFGQALQGHNSFFPRDVTILKFALKGEFTCDDDPEFGNGFLNDLGTAFCGPNEVGEKTAICRENGEWDDRDDNCILQIIAELLFQSDFLNETILAEFLEKLSNATTTLSEQVTESPSNIEAIVRILDHVASFVTTSEIEITPESMEDVLLTTSVLTQDSAIAAWDTLNREVVIEIFGKRAPTPRNESFSSLLLFSLEGLTSRLSDASLNIETPSIILRKTTFTNSFNEDFNSTVEIDIQGFNGATNLTVITFDSLDNVLLPRDENNASGRVINGRVVLVQSDSKIDNISFHFDIINGNLRGPQCVFWNFTLFEGLGGWDDEGCKLVVRENEMVTCQCDHLTSFSILMSPQAPNSLVLDYITYVGVSISILCLIICLCIEGAIWRKVCERNITHLRHVCIVNIALSLLIANIWFIVSAGVSAGKRSNFWGCTAFTFFIHLFYLALFFWMLNYGLLLFYSIVFVFGTISKSTLLAVGFFIGYGVPLIIATSTRAVNGPVNDYIQENAVCWLNWNNSKALLAFVVPVLIIVLINFIILFVVIVRLLCARRMLKTEERDEENVVATIARSVAILTPFLGITWSLGVGTLVDPENLGVHATFAFFNSLEGFFILVFGLLFDYKVCAAYAPHQEDAEARTSHDEPNIGAELAAPHQEDAAASPRHDELITVAEQAAPHQEDAAASTSHDEPNIGAEQAVRIGMFTPHQEDVAASTSHDEPTRGAEQAGSNNQSSNVADSSYAPNS